MSGGELNAIPAHYFTKTVNAMRQKKTAEQKQEAVKEPEVKVEETVETPVEETAEEAVEQTEKTPVEETEAPETEQTPEKPNADKAEEEEATTDAEVPEAIDKILRLYPQYEECWISKEGFVYPKNAPKYQRKNAVLYKNKYFNS